MIISKTIEFDMGHRIPYHKSKCRSPHGHRYKLTVYVEGDVIDLEGKSDHGMVMDFSDVKNIMMKEVHDQFDHAFVYWDKDEALCDFYHKEDHFKSIKVPFTPTVENLSAWIYRLMDTSLCTRYKDKLKLHHVELYETPTCKATFRSEDDVPWN